MAKRKLNILNLILLLFVFSLGCTKVPYTERTQVMMFSEEDETQMGNATFEQIKAQSTINSDPQINSVIKEVGQRIAKAADKPDYQWEFVVIEDKDANAFALPGGKVAFYTGILPVCKDEFGIAVVMGHEVSHVLARHGAERLSQQSIISIGKAALMSGLLGGSPAAQEAMLSAYGIGTKVGIMLPYSRKQEAEADRIGLIIMAKAGYNPQSAVEFWKRMTEQAGGRGGPELLSTHPSDEKRIEALESFLPEAMEHYNKAIEANPSLKKAPKAVG
ncbi:MAG: M48 family metallopeptidase [Deltaproteobacteria bacterium]|nr:M48 family metallopeptidase [Deltaproteobacteria bacterium]